MNGYHNDFNTITEAIDYSTINLWDKLDMDTREALALAAGFTKEFAVRAWADITKRERKALKRIWDPAVGEQRERG